jgi:DNA-binding transcriptional regulator YdaS (Cro superfamily)
MSLKSTIDKAAQNAGSQAALAELIGETASHISAFKKGTRYCGYKKRAAIAAIAGENVARAMLEAITEDLSSEVPHEAEAKRALQAILTAFPPETDAQTKNGPKKGPSKKATGGNGR